MDIVNEIVDQNNKEAKSDFIDHYTKYIDYHLYELFLKDRDSILIADAINHLFKTRYDLYSYNKKALYILIRERTGIHTQYITKVVGKLKGIYVELYTEYNQKGYLSLRYKMKIRIIRIIMNYLKEKSLLISSDVVTAILKER